MDVFISWSGDEGKRVAAALREWIPTVAQVVRPWTSEEIDKGQPWFSKITEKLSATNFGIICLTRDCLSSPWLLFEAGAVWKATEQARVCTYLFDIGVDELRWPLQAFNATRADRSDTFKMLQTLNSQLETDARIDPKVLEVTFRRAWPELESQLDGIRRERSDGSEAPQLSDRDVMEDVLSVVNRIERGQLALRQDLVTAGSLSPRLKDIFGPSADSPGWKPHVPYKPASEIFLEFSRNQQKQQSLLEDIVSQVIRPIALDQSLTGILLNDPDEAQNETDEEKNGDSSDK